MTEQRRLTIIALGFLTLFGAIIFRAFFLKDLSGSVCYEIEAARRMLSGEIPFRDFYFDQSLSLVYWRMLTVTLARVLAHGHLVQVGITAVPFHFTAIASYLITSSLALGSFLCSVLLILGRSKLAAGSRSSSEVYLWMSVIGLALANFAMGFSYGCAQHLFCLFFSPYLIVRLISWQTNSALTIAADGQKNITPAARFVPRLLAGFVCGIAASFDPLFILVPLVMEAVEWLNRRLLRRKNIFADEFFALLIGYMVGWSYLLTLHPAALEVLTDWILPLKITSYQLDQIAYFGLGSSPDRRDIIYLCTACAVLSFGLAPRVQVLRPLTSVMITGFVIYLLTMTGLSSELLILIWAMTVAFAVQFGAFIETGLLANLFRRYPSLSYRRGAKVQIVLLAAGCLVASSTMAVFEYKQRQENIAVASGPHALDPDLIDLSDALQKYSKAGQSAMILNGRLLPTFPLYSMSDRPSSGYFISGEPFSWLANVEAHHISDQQLGKPFSWIEKTKKKMFERVLQDIEKEKPQVIVVEGGQTFENLEKAGIVGTILGNYHNRGEARYHSWCGGAREFADWNYRYNVYERR